MMDRKDFVRNYSRFILPIMLSIAALFCLIIPIHAADGVYLFDDDNSVIGSLKEYKVKEGESLIEIARKFDLGYNEITDANSGLDPFVPGTGASVVIPTAWVLPDIDSSEGIVINISELRLYYFLDIHGARFVKTFPIGIGSEGNDTPTGKFKVIEKIIKPSWHVPESIRKENPWLPELVPPGSENPLGSHALRLSEPGILIHGTDRPWGVGRRVSHGCIRLYPEDIPELFNLVSNGVRVIIVRQPIKVGVKNKRVYIEVHRNDFQSNHLNEAVGLLRKYNLLAQVSTKKLYSALEKAQGIPVDISE